MPYIKLTQKQFNKLENLLNSGDRTRYYLKYYEYTCSDQSIEMAEISSFSGLLGSTAEMANRIVASNPNYPKDGVIKFSEEIAKAHFNAVKEAFKNGRNCYLTDSQFVEIAKQVWSDKRLSAYFPGNLELSIERVFEGKFIKAFDDLIGIKNAIAIGFISAGLGAYASTDSLSFDNDNYNIHFTKDLRVKFFTNKLTGKTIYVEETGVKRVENSLIIEGINREVVAKRLGLNVNDLIEDTGFNIDVLGNTAINKRYKIIYSDKKHDCYHEEYKFFKEIILNQWPKDNSCKDLEKQLIESKASRLQEIQKDHYEKIVNQQQEYLSTSKKLNELHNSNIYPAVVKEKIKEFNDNYRGITGTFHYKNEYNSFLRKLLEEHKAAVDSNNLYLQSIKNEIADLNSERGKFRENLKLIEASITKDMNSEIANILECCQDYLNQDQIIPCGITTLHEDL